MEIPTGNLTATQRRIVLVLSDGALHTREELHQKCIGDELSPLHNLVSHLSLLRKRLEVNGYTIITERHPEKWYYRIARTVSYSG